MRMLTIATAAAALLLLPAAQKANACPAGHSAEASTVELSAVAKKPSVEMSAKTKKEKVDYMRSAAGPEPVVKKHKKQKKHKKKKDKM